MQRGDKLIILRDVDTDPATSEIPNMVAALTALGIPLDNDCPYQEIRERIDGREQQVVTWVLKLTSVCGRFETQAMLKAWDDDGFVRANPEHPFSYIKQAFENCTRMARMAATQIPLALIRKGKRIALIPFDASPERREYLLDFELNLPVGAMAKAVEQLAAGIEGIGATQFETIPREDGGSRKESKAKHNVKGFSRRNMGRALDS